MRGIFIFIATISFVCYAMQPIPKVATGPLIIEDDETEFIWCEKSWVTGRAGACRGNEKFCLLCLKEKKKSRVYESAEPSITTLKCAENFWGTDGRFRARERCNIETTAYKCSNGHTWREEKKIY